MGRQRTPGDGAAGSGGTDGAPGERTCARCGRRMDPRRSWRGAASADEVRWCSDACRRAGLRDVDRALEAAVLELLSERAGGATICPSEAARRVGGGDESAWRPLMEPARMAARRLVAAGQVEITQRGRVVDPSTAKGPIRVRWARSGGAAG